MDNNKKDIVTYYLEKKRSGMNFSDIRKELTRLSFNEKTISEIIREIDDTILNEELRKTSRKQEMRLKFPGYILMGFAAIITIGTYTSLINLHGYYIIIYGPFIMGYFMVRASNTNKKKHYKHRTAFIKRKG